jgi:aminomethyltransferase
MDGTDNLRHLPLRALHEELGGSFVPFAGWEMPVRYGPGVMAEHLWCREKAGLFDVSHMGQVMLPPDAAEALEALVPMDVLGLREGRQRYAFFTNDEGGLLDDLMIARHAEGLFLVVNAACAEADIAHLERHVPGVHVLSDRALLALAGADGGGCAGRCVPDVARCASWMWPGCNGRGRSFGCRARAIPVRTGSRFPYPGTGSMPSPARFLTGRAVAPIGLGRARYAPAGGRPAALRPGPRAGNHAGRGRPVWAIQKVRRPGGARAGGYPGAALIAAEIAEGAAARTCRVFCPRAARRCAPGTEIFATETGGEPVGRVTSGGFSPSLGAPIALALIEKSVAQDAPFGVKCGGGACR